MRTESRKVARKKTDSLWPGKTHNDRLPPSTQCNITRTRCFSYYTCQSTSNTDVISTMSYHNAIKIPANISMCTPQTWHNDSIRVRPGDTNQTRLDGMEKKKK